MSDALPVHGACHCGAIEFTSLVDPTRVTICHCTACQQLTGTAYRVTVPTRMEDFHLTRGTPRTYVKVADSGNRRAMVFCGDCGSQLYAHAADGLPDRMGLRVGALRERASLIPRRRIWCQSALPWSENLQGMATFDRE